MSNHRFCCCPGSGDPDPDLPDWVDPDGPGGPGGPQPPTSGDDPRCCTGDTICSPNGTEAIEMGMRLTGTVKNTYVYGSGPNAGNTYSYDVDFNQVYTKTGNTTACEITDSRSFLLTVPYVERSGDGTPVNRNLEIRIDGADWDRERGFFGSNVDFGDNPVTNINSGIALTVGGSSGPIRGTNGAGYALTWRICRTASPDLPIVERPDTFRLSQPVAVTLDSGTLPATEPDLACLNRVVAEFNDSFTVSAGGDTNTIEILYRVYLFASRIAVCEPGI